MKLVYLLSLFSLTTNVLATEDELINGQRLNPVDFYLFTASNPNESTKIYKTTESIKNSNFNSNNPTRFVIHGFSQSYNSSMNDEIREAWLSRGDFNIIIVDWSRARTPLYPLAVAAVAGAGKNIASMIDFLVSKFNMSLETLQVIGHSLGAHVAGYAGKNVKSGKIHTIVGLDPAAPLFSYYLPTTRLASTDAVYVQTIQTNGGRYGFLKPIGKGVFYPNGGKKQPHCEKSTDQFCDHQSSFTYYAEAVTNNDFPTIKCNNYQKAIAKSCGSTYSDVRMGAMTNDMMVAGIYYVPVNKESPYGKGN